MRMIRSQFHRMSDWRRSGAVHCALAGSILLAALMGSMSIEYWSGRTAQMLLNAVHGMTWESYRNLALITVFLGWLLSRAPERSTHFRRPFRP